MVWNPMPPQQQRGAQLHNGGAPNEATAGRGAQKNDEADQQVSGAPAQGIDYPAEPLEQRGEDITPTRGEPSVSWDEVVQPEQQAPGDDEQADDDEPLPEGK
jgi:hypothetical protein